MRRNRLGVEWSLVLQEKLTKKEMILRLHNKGVKQAEIAKEVKTYTNYVWKVINENK